jgi:hypothetical protein
LSEALGEMKTEKCLVAADTKPAPCRFENQEQQQQQSWNQA